MSVASTGGAISPYLLHPCTGIAKDKNKPDSLNLAKAKDRIMRKAGYEKVSGDTYKPLSALKKFNYFSSASRNMHSTARAYHESGHLVTAAFLREVATVQKTAIENAEKAKKENNNAEIDTSLSAAENTVWSNFQSKSGLQKAVKRQDFLNHRMYMFEKGDQIPKNEPTDATNENSNDPKIPLLREDKNAKSQTKGNRFSRIATKFSRIAMSVCECTSAPTGFTYKVLRNAVFHGTTEGGQINKAGTVAASFVIGMGAAAIIKAIRGTASTGGYGFNPIQMLTGVLVAFAAVSGIAGGISWLAGLSSQAMLKDIEPSQLQKDVLQFDMNSTINKVNELLIQYKNNPTMLKCISQAMRSEMPKQRAANKEGDPNTVCPLLAEWFGKLDKDPIDPKNKTPEEIAEEQLTKKKENLDNAKKAIGDYLKDGSGKIAFNQEKEFAALAGLVEHYEIELESSVTEAEKKITKACLENPNFVMPKHVSTPHTLKADRIDARQFTEEFAQKINRTLLRGLAKPAVVLDIMFRTNNRKISNTLKRYGSDSYANTRKNSLKDPTKAHLHKYHAEYIAANLHQYGPITRALMKASDLIHSVNYNYILAVNAQTSRLYNKAAQTFQESVLHQHSSKIACSALGRFLGGMTVTLVAFFGISSLAALTGGGSAAGGFQNSAQLGSAKMSWLVTGTLMTLVGLPAFALGLAAKAAAALEGWKGNIEKPVKNSYLPYLVHIKTV